MKINKLNKKAAANVPAFTTANKKNRADSFTLSDKIKVLYRFIKLSRDCKEAVCLVINVYYEYKPTRNTTVS